MILHCIWEHNGNNTLLYARDFPGAYARGASLDEALAKLPVRVISWCQWAKLPTPDFTSTIISQDAPTSLAVQDADSDVLFDSEKAPLSTLEYAYWKRLVLKSAADLDALYISMPDKDTAAAPPRSTFYGTVPRTARQMYVHTRSVNSYYFAEIEVDADNRGTILECRERGFAALERKADYLSNHLYTGSYGESWTLRKVIRRFLWHDRIHAGAMWRLCARAFPQTSVPDSFCFGFDERISKK